MNEKQTETLNDIVGDMLAEVESQLDVSFYSDHLQDLIVEKIKDNLLDF